MSHIAAYSRMVWYRASKFGVVTYMVRSMYQPCTHLNCYMCAHTLKWQPNFAWWSNLMWGKFSQGGSQVLSRDPLAVADLLVICCRQNLHALKVRVLYLVEGTIVGYLFFIVFTTLRHLWTKHKVPRLIVLLCWIVWAHISMLHTSLCYF